LRFERKSANHKSAKKGSVSTFSLSPQIFQPEAFILGIGVVVKKPVVIEVEGVNTIGIKPMMYLSLSHDHRMVYGTLGVIFLKYVKDTLENLMYVKYKKMPSK